MKFSFLETISIGKNFFLSFNNFFQKIKLSFKKNCPLQAFILKNTLRWFFSYSSIFTGLKRTNTLEDEKRFKKRDLVCFWMLTAIRRWCEGCKDLQLNVDLLFERIFISLRIFCLLSAFRGDSIKWIFWICFSNVLLIICNTPNATPTTLAHCKFILKVKFLKVV